MERFVYVLIDPNLQSLATHCLKDSTHLSQQKNHRLWTKALVGGGVGVIVTR